MADLDRAQASAEARAATILDLERQILALRGEGGPHRTPVSS
jgi:hypothetical protein